MKIALIYSHKKSSWKSCQTITENLVASYTLAYPKETLLHVDYKTSMSEFELLNEIKKLQTYNPDKIVVLDHIPHPQLFLSLYERMWQAKNKQGTRPEIIFHVFGDFTLFAKDWLKLEKTLCLYAVKFVCASERQMKLISSFLKIQKGMVFLAPFPVDPAAFNFDPVLREKIRKDNGLDEDTIVFVYTGRLSKQKNINELISIFSKYVAFEKRKPLLYLAGPFDNIGTPFLGYISKERYEESCQRLITSLQDSPITKDKVIYLGNLGSDKLKQIYNAADVFVSMSVHNDEDFGMSPAEAICTGLPAILSDWAGYASFKNAHSDNACTLIEVEIAEGSVEFNKTELVHTLLEMSDSLEEKRENRKKLAQLNQSNFSIESTKNKILAICSAKPKAFEGFSPLFYDLELAFQRAYAPFGTIEYKFSYTELYKEIYKSYVRQ